MIVLDTNVLSELMRADAHVGVLSWLARQPLTSLFTTALSEAELRMGLALLPAGKRRAALQNAAEGLFEDFGPRVLPFDGDAAVVYAVIGAARRKAGHPIAVIDAQIAAIVRARGATLATRNVKDFAGCSIPVENPWTA
jgi:predicted nucleic acid-binding protein